MAMSLEQANYCDNLKTGNIETWQQGLCVLNFKSENITVNYHLGVNQSLSESANIAMASRNVANKAIIKAML